MKTKKRLTGTYFTYFNSGAYFDIQSIEYQNIQTKKNLGHLYLVENWHSIVSLDSLLYTMFLKSDKYFHEIPLNEFMTRILHKKLMHLCVYNLRPSLFPSWGGRARFLSSECKTGQADFTDWISFLPTNFIEETSPNPDDLNANTSSFSFRSKSKCFNIANRK